MPHPYVFLKSGAGSANGNDMTTNIIPLKATSVDISTTKSIPSMDVPLCGLLQGESVTAALDLGMASKTVSVNGYILEDTIVKKFSDDAASISRTFTAIEIAQLIHSSIDSTGLQPYQAINELGVLYASKVDSS